MPRVAMTAPTRAGVYRALLRLGGTTHEVADALRHAGVRGTRCDAGACPVRNYLAGLFPCGATFFVDGEWAQWDGGTVRCDLPQPVSRFIEDFDAGRYPGLEADGWYCNCPLCRAGTGEDLQ